MQCEKCKRYIAEDSVFCSFCGASLTGAVPSQSESERKTAIETQLNENYVKSNRLYTPVRVLCYIALVLFLVANVGMAPFYGGKKVLAYIAGAVIAVFLSVLTIVTISSSRKLPIKIISIVCSVIVIVTCLSLSFVYLAKVDSYKSYFPTEGTILVDINTSTTYYSYRTEVVHNPKTEVTLNGQKGQAKITFEEPTLFEVYVSGNGSNCYSKTVSIKANAFTDEVYFYSFKVDIPNSSLYAKVQVYLKRIYPFWDVIFFKGVPLN